MSIGKVIPQQSGFVMKGGSNAFLLLHGLYGNPLEMKYVARRLNQAGYTVHVPYLVGCGAHDSWRQTWRSRWEDWSAQVDAHFQALRLEHRQVSVAGLCIGADLALALAIRRGTEIHGICLYATTLYYDGWNMPRRRYLRAFAYYTPLRFFLYFKERAPYGLKDPRIRTWIEAQMRRGKATDAGAARSSLVGVYESEKMMRYLRRRLPDVITPVLILHAREDDTSSLRSADLVAATVRSPIIRKVVLENSFHIITMDNDKDVVVQETLEFVGSL